MARKRTVVRVGITSQTCQTEIMKAVAKLDGVEKIEVDPRGGTVTIVGEVEPVAIFNKLTKIGKAPEILSVGPTLTSTCSARCRCSLCQGPWPYHAKQHFRPSYHSHHIPSSYSTQYEVVDHVSYPAAAYYGGDTGQCCIL